MKTELKFEYETFREAHNVFSMLVLAYGYAGVDMDYDVNIVTVCWEDTKVRDIRKLERLLELLRDLGIESIVHSKVEESYGE